MIARFTKRSDRKHRLTVVRDDGSASNGRVVPGLGEKSIPHDLAHAIVEHVLRMKPGVYHRMRARGATE